MRWNVVISKGKTVPIKLNQCLHAFDTENPAIVEGLIWTAIAAAALKRFLAHMTQLLLDVPMSTRKVARWRCVLYTS